MSNPLTQPLPDAPWYRQAFRENYLKLYGHRDAAEARRAVTFLASALHLGPRHRLLDLCCGAGRHLSFLGRTVGHAVGLDLSEVLLRTALAQSDGAGKDGQEAPILVQGDMRRLPFADGTFDRLVNLFTSFGYFENDADNLAALCEMARVLRPPHAQTAVPGKSMWHSRPPLCRSDENQSTPRAAVPPNESDPLQVESGAIRSIDGSDTDGGFLAIDHINRDYLLDHFKPRTERTLATTGAAASAGGRVRVIEERNWNASAGCVTKDIIVEDPAGGSRQWRERVRVWPAEEWPALLAAAGLTALARFGDYTGAPHTPASPRLIIIARRTT